MNIPPPIRVLAVDDSPFFHRVLNDLLGHDREIELIGCAHDPYEAKDRLASSQVDVLTLDLEMPRMDGITFLKLIMERKPMPIIVMSSLTPSGSQKAVEALISGAFEVIGKPAHLSEKTSFKTRLIHLIKVAAAAPIRRRRPAMLTRSLRKPNSTVSAYDSREIIVLGASTGGTHAIKEILTQLPATLPGIAIVQHIPAGFSASFAKRLDGVCAMEVREAVDGDILHAGLALIAPGGYHMEIQCARNGYQVVLNQGPLVEHQRPAVDVLFESAAKCAGAHAIALLLTGMGKDGAAGMKRLHDLRAHTVAQDAASCVVYGMPAKAVELGAVDNIVPLEDMATHLMKVLETRNGRSANPAHA